AACLDQLQGAGARVVMTALPLCSVTALSPARFLLLRSILFPTCRLSHATVLERAMELDRRLDALAADRGVQRVSPRPEWYGFDPIHLRRRCRPRAWEEILTGWAEGTATSRSAPLSVRARLRLQLLAPERRWFF